MATDGKATIVLTAVDKTKQAFASAKRNIDGLRSAGEGFALQFGSVGAAVAAAFTAVSLKHLIDAADELSKLEQKTGIAVESLTALKYAGELSDVSVEDLAGGLKKLAINMTAAAGGSKEQAAAFDSIGVKVKTAGGALRNTEDVLGDLADKFAGFADGPEKAALAVALFGKSGDKMIPFLNGGRRGLAEMRDEAHKLGVVFGSELAKEAEEFNDNLTRIKAGIEGVKIGILADLLPALNELLQQLIEGRKAFGGFGAALVELGLRTPAFSSYGEGAKQARDEIAQLNEQLERLRSSPRRRAINTEPALNDALDRAQKRLAYFSALQAKEALALGAGIPDDPRLRQPPKGRAPVPDKGGAADADASLRKQLDGRLQQLRTGLENERDIFQHANAQLADAFAEGRLSIDEFYDGKQRAQLEFLAAQQQGFNAEIRAWEAYRAKVTKPQDKQEADNQIARVLAEQGRAYREAGQAAEDAEAQRVRAAASFRRSLVDLDAQLRELSGDTYGAELLRNAQRMEEARKLLSQSGGDPKRLGELDSLLKRQAESKQLQEQLALLNERQAVAEEAYLVTARARGDGLLSQEAGIQAIRAKSVQQLQELTDAAEALAAKSDDPRMHLWADQLALALAKAKDQVDPTLSRVREATDAFADGIGDAADSVLLNFQSIDEAFRGLRQMLDRLVMQTLLIDPLKQNLKGFLQNLGPSITGFLKGGLGGLMGGSAGAGEAVIGATGDFARMDRAASSIAGIAGEATEAAAKQAAAAGLATVGAAATTAGAALGGMGLTLPAVDLALGAMAEAAASAAIALQLMASAAESKAGGDAAKGVLSLIAHGGGVVGDGGHFRSVPASAFAGALRYHGGGIAGLAPNEVPTVLERGEEVLRRGDPRHRDNGGMARPGKVIHLNVNVQAMPGVTKQTATQQGAAAGRAARAALARND